MKLFIKPFWEIKKESEETLYLKMQRQRLMHDMEKTRQAMEDVYAHFDNVTDPDLIDCYIYEMNSVMKRYQFLIEQAEKLDPPPYAQYSDPLCKETSATPLFQTD